MRLAEKLQQRFRSLSWIEKAFLIGLVLRIAYWLIGAATGLRLPASGLVGFFFFIVTILFLIRSFPRLLRTLLWRVRHRLLMTWIFVGVVPIVLFCLLVAQGFFFLMGQVVGYMTTTEIDRQSELVRSTAHALAWSLSHRGPSTVAMLTEAFIRENSATSRGELGAIVRADKDVFAVPPDGAIGEIPKWSKQDFHGLLKEKDRYYFGAHVGVSNGKTEVFLYQRAPAEYFEELLPNVATVRLDQGTATASGIDFRRTEGPPQSGWSFRTGRADPNPQPPGSLPAGRGWWDVPVNWIVLMPSVDLASGMEDASVALVSSRPSLIINTLFSTLGNFAPIIFIVIVATAIALLIAEIVSILFGAKLTRSITRAVADLYLGTRKVQEGDFSHRIPVRKNKDQLSELASSFNAMTARIEDLIIEVKEKERLENELAIARDVQSQLFPKEVPRLKTLELWGVCQPARTVSGDYYDFVPLGSDRAALAIGDVSGKGISAALLMAHIQSALRSQLMHRENHSGSSAASYQTSPSAVLSILNDHLYTSSAPEKYATFFLGLYADEGGQLIYTNAGHLAPILVRRREVIRLASDGFPVGLFPGVHYDQQTVRLEPGDLLVGFTDGVTETPNRDGEEFGDHRLTQMLVRLAEQPLDRIANEISTTVTGWAGDVERHDDTTLLLARHV